jgi:hypothetical protein
MKIEVARDVHRGIIGIPEDATNAEVMQLRLGACLTDDGDIFCLDCNEWNERCTCLS